MAYHNWILESREEESANKFKELKELLVSKDAAGNLNNYFLAYEHITALESKVIEQEKQIKEYNNFFSLMNKLMPKSSSINDVII